MKKKRISIQIKDSRRSSEKSESSPFVLLFLLSGVLGILSIFNSIDGISLGRETFIAATLLCSALWALWRFKSDLVWLGLVISVSGTICYSWLKLSKTKKQLILLGEHLTGLNTNSLQLTELGIFIGLLLCIFTFAMECVWHLHLPLYLLTTAVVAVAPFFSVDIKAPALLSVMVFQISFWIWNASVKSHGKKKIQSENTASLRGRVSLIAAFVMAVVFIFLGPALELVSVPLYQAAGNAEGLIYRNYRSLSGSISNQEANGQVSFGNNYHTGAKQMELVTSVKPTQPLYLRGFTGSLYTGGSWKPADEKKVFHEVAKSLHWEKWEDYIGEMYYSMYFMINAGMYSKKGSRPIFLTIYQLNSSNGSFSPYYSVKDQYSKRYDSMQSKPDNSSRQMYVFYEQKDMNINWKKMEPQYANYFKWNLSLQRAYKQAAQTSYTMVQTGRVPRLVKLVHDNPQKGLDNTTAFIIHTLESRASYSTTPGWAPFSEDIVEDFLFDRGSGYCVHFASTATLMYQLYGIPARYVSGFRVDPNAFHKGKDGFWHATVTDTLAHAWTEIFVDNYGWTPVEVTPSTDGSMSTSYPGFNMKKFHQIQKRHASWKITKTSRRKDSRQSAKASGSQFFLSLPSISVKNAPDLLITCIIVLLYACALIPLLLMYRRQKKLSRLDQMNSRQIFGQLLSLLDFTGVLSGYTGNEPDFAAKLSSAVPPLSESDAAKLTRIIQAAAFGAEPETAEDAAFVRNFYKNVSTALESKLGGWKKWEGKYIKALF
ncbi:MAG: transglutaminase domain-containing protein [Lachnospiraceae bacterium]|uniref:Transglutaminase domain-containing protein n=1 Tax=Candidatus Weimeria bifida TaxID=2599074 RepID=A0A6N7J0A6_9FIRM|nr:transglutaminase domain-containing protein [Candidatus Weimeria bifida]RRF96808.1 MAG: transglutaminase domain-containing protein [Lachnospiraceae bacterium]